ncbi:MAG: leucine-rich repeat domain-containing protein [Clostridia bacterium]|nr:leucine-rich repeat domain-containing protein [Clostridia bacterium]
MTKDGKTLYLGFKTSVIPDSVTIIGERAFSCCHELENITIPDSVTVISKSAFASCYGLTSITIGKGVTFIEDAAFAYCTALTEINYNVANCTVNDVDNYVFAKAGQDKDGITVNFGTNVINIPQYLFFACNSKTVESRNYAPKITKVNFVKDSRCESIGTRAFAYCTSLTSVAIPDSVTSIGGSVFNECTSLTSAIIGNSVTTINDYMFYGCTSLTSITMPNSVTRIGSNVFGLTSLAVIYYMGTIEQGDNISIGSYNKTVKAKMHYYSEEEPTSDGNYWHYDTDGITPIVWTKEN